MKIQLFECNPFAENTYVLYDETGEAIIVDPGMYGAEECAMVERFVQQRGLQVRFILLTHAHIDHILGLTWAQKRYGVEVYYHPDEQSIMDTADDMAVVFGLDGGVRPPEDYSYIGEGTSVAFGMTELEVLHVPGHSPGHLCFLERGDKMVLGGDVLFRESIGRTDLPGGDHDTLIASIYDKLLPLGDEWRVYPGHGPATTIGHERKHNPFLQQYQ